MYDAGCKAAISFHLARPQRLSNPETTLIVQELVRHSSDAIANKHVIRIQKHQQVQKIPRPGLEPGTL
jgi:hypothetical protein